MKLITGWVMSAGLVLSATAANAQVLAPYQVGGPSYSVVSDVNGPYAAMPSEAASPRYGPTLLPATEVYTVLRENGFLPLGIPQQRGLVYMISVLAPGGGDGRLMIDARTGRIIRFMPAHRMGDNFNEDLNGPYRPAGPLPPVGNVRGPSPPPVAVPHVASRTPSVPIPRAAPPQAGAPKPQAARPASGQAQQSAAVQAKPSDAPAAPQAAAPAIVEAKPAPQIQPTQEMPKVQGLD